MATQAVVSDLVAPVCMPTHRHSVAYAPTAERAWPSLATAVEEDSWREYWPSTEDALLLLLIFLPHPCAIHPGSLCPIRDAMVTL